MRQIRILHAITPLTIAGAERIVLMLLNNIDKKRFNVTVCVFINNNYRENLFVEALRELNAEVVFVYLKKTFSLFQVKVVRKILKEKAIEIIHTHSHRADVTCYFANLGYGAKIVSTLHGWTPVTGKLKFYELIDLKILKRFDLIIAVSEDIKGTLQQKGISSFIVTTLTNCLDPHYYSLNADRNAFRDELQISEEEILIGSVGRLSIEKGLEYFLMAAKNILKLNGKVKFVIIGDGPMKNTLINLSNKLCITDNVKFVGYRTDISNIFKAIDIFVQPSLSEGVPITLLESSYFSTPFVATNVGGIPDLFSGKALLVDPGNVTQLTEKILYLINNPSAALSYGKKINEHIHAEYSCENWINKMEELYLQLLGEKNEPGLPI